MAKRKGSPSEVAESSTRQTRSKTNPTKPHLESHQPSTTKPPPQKRSTTKAKSSASAKSKQPSKGKPTKSTSKETTQDPNPDPPTDAPDNDIPPSSPKAPEETRCLKLNEIKGDIFTSTPNSLLIHACNCAGSWNAGIAKAFRTHYPAAFEKYAAHCRKWKENDLIGTGFLIPPSESGPGNYTSSAASTTAPVFIGCLFTSRRYGKVKDSPKQILNATKPAMEDLLRQVKEWNEECDRKGGGSGEADGKVDLKQVKMCKINSGLFAVPWEETVSVLEWIEVEEGGVGAVTVVDR